MNKELEIVINKFYSLPIDDKVIFMELLFGGKANEVYNRKMITVNDNEKYVMFLKK